MTGFRYGEELVIDRLGIGNHADLILRRIVKIVLKKKAKQPRR